MTATEAMEAELLQKIHKNLPKEVWDEFHVLKAKRRAETLTPEEHKRLTEVYNQIEIWYAERLGYIVELARARNQPLDKVMHDLGIVSPGVE